LSEPVAHGIQTSQDDTPELACYPAAPAGFQLFGLGTLLPDEVLSAGVGFLECRFWCGRATLARTLNPFLRVV
jgi:hypothetical protein